MSIFDMLTEREKPDMHQIVYFIEKGKVIRSVVISLDPVTVSCANKRKVHPERWYRSRQEAERRDQCDE